MKRQKKQMVVLLVLLVAVIGAYFGIVKYNEWSSQREKEKEEAAQVYITDFSMDSVEKFSYDYQGVTFAFTKQGEDWIYIDDETLDIDESSLESMISDAVQLDASEKIENVTDLSQYGMEEPALTVGFTVSGKDYTLCVGDYNDILSMYYAYLTEDGSTVYLISSGFKTGFNTTLDQLVVVVEETETETETESVVE